MASTTLTFYVETALGRLDALERRNEIIDHLRELGLRLSMTDDGTYIHMADVGAKTISDVLADAHEGAR